MKEEILKLIEVYKAEKQMASDSTKKFRKMKVYTIANISEQRFTTYSRIIKDLEKLTTPQGE